MVPACTRSSFNHANRNADRKLTDPTFLSLPFPQTADKSFGLIEKILDHKFLAPKPEKLFGFKSEEDTKAFGLVSKILDKKLLAPKPEKDFLDKFFKADTEEKTFGVLESIFDKKFLAPKSEKKLLDKFFKSEDEEKSLSLFSKLLDKKLLAPKPEKLSKLFSKSAAPVSEDDEPTSVEGRRLQSWQPGTFIEGLQEAVAGIFGATDKKKVVKKENKAAADPVSVPVPVATKPIEIESIASVDVVAPSPEARSFGLIHEKIDSFLDKKLLAPKAEKPFLDKFFKTAEEDKSIGLLGKKIDAILDKKLLAPKAEKKLFDKFFKAEDEETKSFGLVSKKIDSILDKKFLAPKTEKLLDKFFKAGAPVPEDDELAGAEGRRLQSWKLGAIKSEILDKIDSHFDKFAPKPEKLGGKFLDSLKTAGDEISESISDKLESIGDLLDKKLLAPKPEIKLLGKFRDGIENSKTIGAIEDKIDALLNKKFLAPKPEKKFLGRRLQAWEAGDVTDALIDKKQQILDKIDAHFAKKFAPKPEKGGSKFFDFYKVAGDEEERTLGKISDKLDALLDKKFLAPKVEKDFLGKFRDEVEESKTIGLIEDKIDALLGKKFLAPKSEKKFPKLG